jgi:hypothetical protein
MLALLLLASTATPVEARIAVSKYAACVVKKKGYRARLLLDEPIGEKGAGSRWAEVMNSDCLTEEAVGEKYEEQAEMRFTPMIIRGAIYEILLAKDYGQVAKIDNFETVKSVKYAAQAKLPSSAEAAYSVAMNIGECTVREATEESYALLAAAVGSAEEKAATSALLPKLEACTPQGVSLEFSMSVVRGMIAEPMYRMTKAKAEMGE